MKPAATPTGFWIRVPPWILAGALAVLVPILTFQSLQDIQRQKAAGIRLLSEKGVALIRTLEAGARVGIMGGLQASFRFQNLLLHTARQPDVDFLLLTDIQGKVLAASDPARVGTTYGADLRPAAGDVDLNRLNWRTVPGPSGGRTFEVYQRFRPLRPPISHRHRRGGGRMGWLEPPDGSRHPPADTVIFVGLDMDPVVAARRADTRRTLILAGVLLLAGMAGILLLFLAQSYRAARSSLSRIQAFSDTLVARMPVGLLAIDADRCLISLNPAAADLLGVSPAAAVGRPASEILPPEIQVLADDLPEKRTPVEEERDCRMSDGRILPLQVGISILRDEPGQSPELLILLRDLSEVRALRREIARSQRLATVGSLAAGVAHEIRNPLSSIKGFATYFKQRYADVEEDLTIADLMVGEVDRLNRVVGQLLELSRPVRIEKRPTDMLPLLQDAIKLVQQQAEAYGIEIRTDLPETRAPALLDADRFRQVLLNLLLNAVESMETGGLLEVGVTPAGPGQGLTVRVADSGRGIGSLDLPRIFDPYYTTRDGGTGIGLAIVHNIVEAHGGRIQVESRPGRTVFTVILPPEDKD